MTHWQDKFEGWLKKFFVDEEYNRKMEEYERKQFFLRTIADEGYKYDQDNEWWVRKWTTNNGKESILEVYQQQYPSGKWKQLMIGYGDRCFYEEDVVESIDDSIE